MIVGPKNDPVKKATDRGVYTLANDKVIEWFQAFIRSFRKHNPNLSLTVIPYDQNMTGIQALQEQFHFEIMEAAECDGYDALAEKVKVIKKEAGCFRKFASFFGKYREFLFLDADIVDLVSLEPLFDAFSKSEIEFAYFDVSMSACYKGPLAVIMEAKYHSPAYNSGAFFSRSGLVAPSQIEDVAEKATAICDGFAIGGEQPFLNYFTDTLQLSSCCFDSLMPEYAGAVWARQALTYGRKEDEIFDAKGRIMPFIHWPGSAYPTMEWPREFLRYRVLGYSRPVQFRYILRFKSLRYRIQFLKAAAHGRYVVFKFLTSKAWRKFYFCKLMGIKVNLPS